MWGFRKSASPGGRVVDALGPVAVVAVSFLIVSSSVANPEPIHGEALSIQVKPGIDWEQVLSVGIAESASEGYDGLYATFCVMRNRNYDLSGFSASKRGDLRGFVGSQPASVRRAAERALGEVRAGGADTTLGASHYENVEAFGLPYWAKGMRKTVKIGRHTFFRSRA